MIATAEEGVGVDVASMDQLPRRGLGLQCRERVDPAPIKLVAMYGPRRSCMNVATG
jgi:hypothetical protein